MEKQPTQYHTLSVNKQLFADRIMPRPNLNNMYGKKSETNVGLDNMPPVTSPSRDSGMERHE